MRAINLIPPEERRGRGPSRAGSLPYLVVGVLIAILAAVTALVLTNKQVSDREAEVAQLEQQRAAAEARAQSLQAFADFRSMQELRTATVTSLAESRFDWERVMRELSRVLPRIVWLTGLEGTVAPDVQLDGGVDVSGRETVAGPALELVGCTVGQEAVGRFAAAIRDIDGVTRVTVVKSERPEQQASTAEASGGGGEAGEECRTFDFITRFEIIAAFDEVPPPPAAATEAPPAAPATGDEAPAATAQSESQAEVEEGVENGQEAANLVPGA